MTVYRVNDKVPCSCGCGVWWQCKSLEWHERANNGCDIEGHRLSAVIDGDRLRVQHGDNPEAVRWFTLDELNALGATLDERMHGGGDGPLSWCDEIDRQMGVPRA